MPDSSRSAAYVGSVLQPVEPTRPAATMRWHAIRFPCTSTSPQQLAFILVRTIIDTLDVIHASPVSALFHVRLPDGVAYSEEPGQVAVGQSIDFS